ncbi:MAG: exodeoxyribonuclease VII small subunit [Nitrospiraceae bacterium]
MRLLRGARIIGLRASEKESEPMAPVRFEQALARLETIVSELENGDLSLDESLKIFEEGIKLSKTCLKMLDDAEHKVEILIQDKDGKKRLRALTLEEDEDEPARST